MYKIKVQLVYFLQVRKHGLFGRKFMKKLILTSIITLTSLNALAADCVHNFFNLFLNNIVIYDEEYDGLVPDSIIGIFSPQNEFDTSYTKNYWNGHKIDSIVTKMRFKDPLEWKTEVTIPNKEVSTEQRTSFRFISISGYQNTHNEYLIYRDSEKDSIYYTKDFFPERGQSQRTEVTAVIRNDTLFIHEFNVHYNVKHDYFVVNNADDNNKCYYYMDSQHYTYEYKTKGDTLIEKMNYTANVSNTTFYVPVYTNEHTTGIIHKDKPVFIRPSSKPFDLLGRPAKGKYTVNFLK